MKLKLSAHFAVAAVIILIAGCGKVEQEPAKTAPTEDPWYRAAVQDLNAINREAEGSLAKGNPDEAATAITKGQLLMARLLSVPRPTLDAMEAASDLDGLYGRMLLSNKHYGWARMLFQKNLARWTNWRPQTPETIRRRKLAETAIATCDRALIDPSSK